MFQFLAITGGLGMAACQWLIMFYAPVEINMGPIQKIFYLHLPFALWSLISFLTVFIFSIAYLARRKPDYDNFCVAAAEIGVLFSSLALLSGMIWGKQSWGVWWTWDPRLTTTFVLWFIYVTYLVIGTMDWQFSRIKIVRAVLGIVAFLDVPLVFLSARLFRSIHPAVFSSESGSLEPEMKYTVCACILSLGILWLALLLFRKKQLDQKIILDNIFMAESE